MTWAIVAMAIGLLLLFVEVFIPTGGMLVMLGIMMLATGVVIIFITPQSEGGGAMMGSLFMGGVIVLLAMLGFYFTKYWPQSRSGKEFFLSDPTQARLSNEEEAEVDARERLIGQVGRTVTPHQPSGATEINGRRYDSMSEGLFLDVGQFVKVINLQSQYLIVRAFNSQELSDLPSDLNS